MMDRYKEAIETFNKQAANYQAKYMDVSLYKETLALFCKLITKTNARILDVGCGPGNVTKHLLKERPDFKITGIDMAPNMIALAKENNPGVEFMLMDCREISTLTGTFEGIMCGFCMPYLSKEDCMNFIRDCALLLNPGGIVYFSTMEDDPSKSGYEYSSDGKDKAYINYHSEDYLREGLEKNGFEVIRLDRKKYVKANGDPVNDMIFVAEKNKMQ